MSEETVEIVKRANAALNAHDVDGLFSLLHPDYEFVDHMGAVAEESGSGIETIRRQIEGWIESFPDFRAETEEYIDADDRVVCVTHWRGTGAGSGLTYSQRAAEVYTLRNGLIVRAELGFPDKAAALEAAGLRELGVASGKVPGATFFWERAPAPRPTNWSAPSRDTAWAMSEENVEVVRGIYDAVARRDDVTPYEVYAEDIVWDLSNSGRELLLTKPVYQGHEGVRQFWREGLSVFGEIDFEVDELIDAGDQVLAVIREREVGRASGVPVETTHLAVWTLADGKVTQMQVFDDRQQALEAAGLSE